MASKRHDTAFQDFEKEGVTQLYDVGHGREPLLVGVAAAPPREARRVRYIHQFTILSLLFIFLVYSWQRSSYYYYHLSGQNQVSDKHSCASSSTSGNMQSMDAWFNWTDHKPSKELNWTKCYERFGDYQCARLTVPFDYSNPSGREAAIALLKSPSRYSQTHEKYRGPILFNPGGPGGSGIYLVLTAANAMKYLIGEEFDFVGFDPRGVGETTPQFSVFPTSVEAGAFFLQLPTNINTSSAALGEAYAHGQVLAQLVEDRSQDVAQHLSTPTVARDMLSIINAAGQEKLQYWGFSYGSVLGATFAAMFPDKVERIIIDGVVDSEDYYKGLWSNNLRDTDAALENIYKACVEAGPNVCAIYENSTELVAQRVSKALDKLKKAPIPYFAKDPFQTQYDVIDYTAAKVAIFGTLYNPSGYSFLYLTQALLKLEHGDGDLIYMMSMKAQINYLMHCSCPAPGELPVPFHSSIEGSLGIACGDAADSSETLEDIREAYDEMAKSSTFADLWTIRAVCPAWKSRATDRFDGSFKQNTSFPLLLVGNVADPVTPLWNAHKMSEGFNGSVVLTQNSTGHCSISASSLCTMKAIKAYFVNGTLPEKGKVCDVESTIAPKDPTLDAEMRSKLTLEDQQLLAALDELQLKYPIPRLGVRSLPGMSL